MVVILELCLSKYAFGLLGTHNTGQFEILKTQKFGDPWKMDLQLLFSEIKLGKDKYLKE